MEQIDILSQQVEELLGFRGREKKKRAILFGEFQKMVMDCIAGAGLGSNPAFIEMVPVTGDYIVGDGDAGKALRVSSDLPVTLTFGADVKEGASLLIIRAGAGEVRFANAVCSEIKTFVPGHNKMGMRWGIATALCIERPQGKPTVWLLSGDTA